jgi:hypothetical protein
MLARGGKERLNQVNDDGFGFFCARDQELRLPRETVVRTELQHMIRIGGARGLREQRQRPRHCAVMMPGAVPVVMQHESQTIGISFEAEVMIGINTS